MTPHHLNSCFQSERKNSAKFALGRLISSIELLAISPLVGSHIVQVLSPLFQAKETYRHIKREYKAGLWLDYMHTGLLCRLQILERRRQKYIAPSWSWSSLDLCSPNRLGSVSWAGIGIYPRLNVLGTQHKTAKILEVNVIAIDEDLFGLVFSSYLRINGPSQKVCMCRNYRSFDC